MLARRKRFLDLLQQNCPEAAHRFLYSTLKRSLDKKTSSNHSNFVTSVTSDLELTKNKLVTDIVSAKPAALWHPLAKTCVAVLSALFARNAPREAPQRGRYRADNIDDQLVLCQFEVVCHADNKIEVV